MEVEKTLKIGKIGKHFVQQIASVKPNITVYEALDDTQYVTKTLFFTQNNKVLFSMYISADCSQNVGFIDQLEFRSV